MDLDLNAVDSPKNTVMSVKFMFNRYYNRFYTIKSTKLIEKVLLDIFRKHGTDKSKYTLRPLMCQNMIYFNYLTKSRSKL